MHTARIVPRISCSRRARSGAIRQIVLLLLFVAGLASPLCAQKTKPMSVAQMEQWLAGVHGRADEKVAKQLGGLELTERVNRALLARWQANLPGSQSRAALMALADLSAFLDPPAADQLAAAPPDLKAQGAMLSSAIDYVVQTLTKLPDFYATRTTEHFQDTPSYETISTHQFGGCSSTNGCYTGAQNTIKVDPYEPLHTIGQSSVVVSYRDGVEIRGTQKMDRSLINQPAEGFTTAGEFGPILSVVLDDAMHNTIAWGYWEQGPHGKVAVFRYAVPVGQSSYAVALQNGATSEKLFPAYHGEIAIDPASGAILRITVVANPDPSHDVKQSDILVEYGVVSLGGKDYICPVKSAALLKSINKDAQRGHQLRTKLNEVTFTGYHVLRGDVRILPEQP
jgi:hypothetical protein